MLKTLGTSIDSAEGLPSWNNNNREMILRIIVHQINN
ncbi:MAG: hypothetical protein ACJA0X_000978 [Cyclobacteriaceae bacterium]|jgi:hypothetical protein